MNNKSDMHSGRALSAILKTLVMVCAVLTFAVLVFLIAFILVKGVAYLKPGLFAWEYTSENVSLIPAAVNTVVMTVLTLLIAVPIGVFAAVFLVEYSGKGSKIVQIIRMTAETLSGIPSIVYGLFGLMFFATNTGVGAVHFIRRLYHGHHDFTIDHADNRGSTQGCAGCLQRSQFWIGSGQTADHF